MDMHGRVPFERTHVPGVDALSAAADACLEAGSSIARYQGSHMEEIVSKKYIPYLFCWEIWLQIEIYIWNIDEYCIWLTLAKDVLNYFELSCSYTKSLTKDS